MAGFHLKGALVEYGTDLLGPLPNIVVFQFNPEQIARTLNMANSQDQPENDEEESEQERAQASGPPVESFSITAHFSAADDLGEHDIGSAIPRLFGVGPQLAALEKMVYPDGYFSRSGAGASLDEAGDAVAGATGQDESDQPMPREQLPRILFIWGPNRVLPVELRSMSITEQKYDPLLNPVQAEVQIGLAVAPILDPETDAVGYGAFQYTQMLKKAQSALNLVRSAESAIEIIPF